MTIAWLEYRVPVSAFLLVASLGSMFVLTSQSGSSFATYLLAIYTFAGARRWAGLWTDWLFLLSCAISALVAVSSLWSEPFDARGALSQVVRAVLVIAFVVAVAEGFRVDWFREGLTKVVAILGAAAAFGAIAVFLLDPPEDGRLQGLGQLHVHVRAALVFGAALICAVAWAMDASTRGVKVFVWCAAFTLATAIALSGSRNAWASVTFGTLVFIAAKRITPVRTFLTATASVGVVGVSTLALAMLDADVRAFLLPRGDSYRLQIWTETLTRWWHDGIWFGRGVLTPDDVAVDQWLMPHAHNIYLAVLHQVGIVGLALFGVLVAGTLASLIRFYATAEAKLGIGILAIALPSYLLDGYQLVDKIGWSWMLLWLPIAIAIGLRSGRVLEDAQRFGHG